MERTIFRALAETKKQKLKRPMAMFKVTTLIMIIFFSAFIKISKAELIRVYAAADLQYALPEITSLYEKKYPQDKVETIFGSSGKGFSQIQAGAPFHLFLSADMSYVEKLYQMGLIVTKPKPYAKGILVIWVRADSGLNPSNFPNILLDPRVKKIAIANWEHAPYGRAAKEVLENYGIFEKVKNKLVLGENVSQTASFVYSKSAEVGFIPLSLALSENMKKVGLYYIVSEDKYKPIIQGYGITKYGENSPGAKRLYEFLSSPEATQIFKKYGFERP